MTPTEQSGSGDLGGRGDLGDLGDLALVDHHCHGVVTTDLSLREFELLSTEASIPAPAGTTFFDSQLGLSLRQWCPPVLGLAPHSGPAEYLDRRRELGAAEVIRRLLRAARHPVVTPPRTRIEETVLDLTQTAATFDEAIDWIIRGCGSRRTTPERLAAAMHERARMRWRVKLGTAVGGIHSMLEYRHVYGVERPHGLPRGTRQARAVRRGRSQYRDQLYEEFGVCVELDGQLAHPAAARWRDIRRDNASAAAGLITLRYGWADVTHRPCEVAAEIGTVLSSRGWTGTPRRCGPACMIRALSAA